MPQTRHEVAMLATRSPNAWDPASSIPTLTGSLLSAAATFVVILLWVFARGRKRREFRYALVLNLTVAEFLNSLNNSISGVAVVVRKAPLSPGPLCNLNGWMGQFSVQAVDFSILAISIITLLIIQLRSFVLHASITAKTLICLSTWLVPLCTSVFAYLNNYYAPVSGNWCWISPHFSHQRYVLTHGWRFAILFITLCTYIFVFIYMSRRVKPQSNIQISASNCSELDFNLTHTLTPDSQSDPKSSRLSSTAARRARIDREVWRMMLLNMYPITYLILWLPGIANRIAEAMGRSSRVLVILQSSTQFIGLANAGLYLYKEHGSDVWRWWRGGQRGEDVEGCFGEVKLASRNVGEAI